MLDRPPAAFLSHSAKDAEIARKLAHDLRSNGVDVWYAEWEIKGGDSLRRKIDEGISRASHFLVLLTPNSLNSEWVQVELDAAMVKRIEGSCRLVPVLSGIAEAQVPSTLRGTLWVGLEPYEQGLRRLLEACHNVSTKPPLGPMPAWAAERRLDYVGLSVHAQRLGVLLNERSELGLEADLFLDIDEIEQVLGLTDEELALAADELEERGMISLVKDANSRMGFHLISPTAQLFFETDPALKHWDPEADAKQLAAAAVNKGDDTILVEELARDLGWQPRRANPAVQYLISYGYAESLGGIGCYPYAYHGIMLTPKTRRFAIDAR